MFLFLQIEEGMYKLRKVHIKPNIVSVYVLKLLC